MDIEYDKIIAIFLATVLASVVFKGYRKIIFGAGIYHSSSWFFDNPIWISAELAWGIRGVLGMIVIAIVINVGLFFYFRNKDAKFTLWNAVVDGLVERNVEYQEKFLQWSKRKRKNDFIKKFDEWKRKKTFLKSLLLTIVYIPAQIYIMILPALEFVMVIGAYVPMKLLYFLSKMVQVPFWGDAFALIVLSILQDPFIATTYVRHGDMGKLDWKIISIFLVSLIVSLGYWSSRNGLITELIIRPVVF